MEEAGHTIDGGTRGEVEAIKTALKESEADEENRNEDVEKPDLKRKGTMQETIEVGQINYFSRYTLFGPEVCAENCSNDK